MKIEVKNLPKSEIKLTIEIAEEETSKYYDLAVKQISKMVKVPGFRPGEVPADVLKKHIKEGAIEAHMLDIALPEIYTKAIKEKDIKAISKPKINILSAKPIKFEATVAVYPEVTISGYDKLKIKKKEVKVEDKDVEEVIKDLQKRHASYKEVDRTAKMGDRVEIDFEGFDEGGAVLEGTKSQNHPVILGEGTLVKGFEDELVGLKKSDDKRFKLTFPKDYYHKQFQGKKVEFRIKVNRVDEVKLPELTPEFFKKVSNREETLEEAKKNIKENLALEREHQSKVNMENEFLEKIINLTKVELPEALIEEEIDGMIEEFKNELEGRGINLQKYLEATKKEMKELREDRRKEAENRLLLRFGLQQLFKQENIDASEEEIKKEIKHVLSLYPESEQKKLKDEYKKSTYLRKRLENKIKMDKMFDRYLPK